MPRYVVERDFPEGLNVPVDEAGARACLAVVDSNMSEQVTWLLSGVSLDKRKSFCVYDAPSPEALLTTRVCTMPANVVSSSIPNVQPAMRPAERRPTPRHLKSGR